MDGYGLINAGKVCTKAFYKYVYYEQRINRRSVRLRSSAHVRIACQVSRRRSLMSISREPVQVNQLFHYTTNY